MFFAGYRGHLATVTSAAENQFVSAYLTANPPHNTVWLGGYQDLSAPDYREPAGGWRWVTGEPWAYTSWGGAEPNNAGNEHALQANQNGHWNDLGESARLADFLVEFEPAAVPGAPRLAFLPNPVIGGQSSIGQVVLDRPAAPGDVGVALASSDPAVATGPAVVIVPAGETTATFSLVTFPVSDPAAVLLTASGPGGTRGAMVQVLPVGTPFPPGNLLVNGSFEQPRLQPGEPASALPGWRITRGSVDLVPASTWQPAPGEGSQSLDLVGDSGGSPTAAGTIEQTISTQAGRDYLLSGWVAHNPGNPVAPEGRANVFLNGHFFIQLFHRDTRATEADMRWTPFAYRFRAAGPTTTLAIADVTGTWDQGGLTLDGLSVTPIPPNLLVNGSFEEPDLTRSGQSSRPVDAAGLPGWRLYRGTAVVVHRRSWQPAPGQGEQSLHMLGEPGSSGILEQSVVTEPGRMYVLTGWMAHHPNVSEGRVNLYANGDLLTQLLHSSAHFGTPSPADMRWQPFRVSFRATGETTTLQFVDGTGISETEGAVLDGLTLAPAGEPPPGPGPVAPGGLAARALSPTQINLAWVDNSADETGFEIERRTGTGDWTRLAIVAANVTRFGDLEVTPGTTYTYRVRAVNDMGASAWSNEAVVTTQAGL
jgi:hypothetical protein